VDLTFNQFSAMLMSAAYPTKSIRPLTCPREQGTGSSEKSQSNGAMP